MNSILILSIILLSTRSAQSMPQYDQEGEEYSEYPDESSDDDQQQIEKRVNGDVMDALNQYGYAKMVSYMAKAQLDAQLKSGGPWTVFVPAPNVFPHLEKYMDALEIADLANFLQNHVVNQELYTNQLYDGFQTKAVNGASINFGQDPETGEFHIGVEDGVANIEEENSNVQASNGVVHQIDWALFLDTQES